MINEGTINNVAEQIRHIQTVHSLDSYTYSKTLQEVANYWVKNTSASDYISASYEVFKNMRGLWTEEKVWKKYMHVPADLLIANTIPIKNIEFETYFPSFGAKEKYRVIIFEEKQRVHYSDFILVGLLLWATNEYVGIAYPIMLYPDIDLIPHAANIGIYGDIDDSIKIEIFNYLNNKEKCDTLMQMFSEMLACWYSTEISLLHPQIKEVFLRQSGKEKRTIKETNKKRRTVYIKRHIVNLNDFQSAIKTHERTYKCLAWYVCGHWRQYKTGAKIFIQGYWKGILRNTKRNFDEGRDRILLEGGQP